MSTVYVIMGVSGCGKTTVGKHLAEKVDVPFYDADDYHLPSNIVKMASGIPLKDDDRWPWLDILAIEIQKWQQGKGAVLACSALKEVYRSRLFGIKENNEIINDDHSAFAKAQKYIIYLKADFDSIATRLDSRKNHFFDPSLLRSQFDTLEVPHYGLHIDATIDKKEIVDKILQMSR